MNPLARQAREQHRRAGEAAAGAELCRRRRDELVRRLWVTERPAWSYARLASAVGCSPELIAKIVVRRG